MTGAGGAAGIGKGSGTMTGTCGATTGARGTATGTGGAAGTGGSAAGGGAGICAFTGGGAATGACARARCGFDAYVAAVGRVAHAWNYLHEKLGMLFVAVSGMERNLALSIWYSVTNDHFQREMLKAAVSATNSERLAKLPKAPDDLKWLLDRAAEVALPAVD